MDLRSQLIALWKGDKLVGDYLGEAKTIEHPLIALGEPILERIMIMYTIQDLGSWYNDFFSSINKRLEPVGIDELHNLLANHDRMLLRQHWENE